MSTAAPTSVSLALIVSASCLETFSLTGLGAPSTRSLASFRPSPVSSRTTLITWIFLSPTVLRMASNSVCSSTAAAPAPPPPAAAPPPAGAIIMGAAALTPNFSSSAFTSLDRSIAVRVPISSTIWSIVAFAAIAHPSNLYLLFASLWLGAPAGGNVLFAYIALAVLVCLAGPPWGAFRRRRRRHGLHNRRMRRLNRRVYRSGGLSGNLSGRRCRSLRSLLGLLPGPQRREHLDERARGGVEDRDERPQRRLDRPERPGQQLRPGGQGRERPHLVRPERLLPEHPTLDFELPELPDELLEHPGRHARIVPAEGDGRRSDEQGGEVVEAAPLGGQRQQRVLGDPIIDVDRAQPPAERPDLPHGQPPVIGQNDDRRCLQAPFKILDRRDFLRIRGGFLPLQVRHPLLLMRRPPSAGRGHGTRIRGVPARSTKRRGSRTRSLARRAPTGGLYTIGRCARPLC